MSSGKDEKSDKKDIAEALSDIRTLSETTKNAANLRKVLANSSLSSYSVRHWTEREKSRLRQLFHSGTDLENMALMLTRSENSIMLMLVHMELLTSVDLSNNVKITQGLKEKVRKEISANAHGRGKGITIQAIVVANSYKKNGRCLAVIDLQTSELLRPVFDEQHREVPASFAMIKDNGNIRPVRPGDFITIPLLKPDVSFWQNENWFVDEKRFITLVIEEKDFLWARARDAARSYYEEPDFILRDDRGSIPSEEVSRQIPTLELRSVTDLRFISRIRNNGTPGLRVAFKYKRQEFSFSYTGEQSEFIHGSKLDSAVICLSLGEEYHGKHYKLVAGVLRKSST